jgi:hypothetical protein
MCPERRSIISGASAYGTTIATGFETQIKALGWTGPLEFDVLASVTGFSQQVEAIRELFLPDRGRP